MNPGLTLPVESADGSLPLLVLITFLVHGANHEEEHVMVEVLRLLGHCVIVVAQNLQLRLGCIDVLVFHDAAEGVAHDCDEHVEHG